MTNLGVAVLAAPALSDAAAAGLGLLALALSSVAAIVGEPADESLVERAQAGDTAAFSALVRRHQDRVFSLCLRWLRDPALAEEVAQDVFVSVHRAIGAFAARRASRPGSRASP